MARARLLKPGFFRNEHLAEVSPWGRLLFAGLWTLADREGRLLDRPRVIKLDVFPFDDGVNVGELLAELVAHGFIVRYSVAGERLIQIATFTRHQRIHKNEPESELAPMEQAESPIVAPVASKCPEAEAEAEAEAVNETEAVPAVAAFTPRLHGDGAMGNALPRYHRGHTLCSPNMAWCVPEPVHAELKRLLAPKFDGSQAQANIELCRWYPTVWARLPAETVMSHAFKFWQEQFDVDHATKHSAVASKQSAAIAQFLAGGAS